MKNEYCRKYYQFFMCTFNDIINDTSCTTAHQLPSSSRNHQTKTRKTTNFSKYMYCRKGFVSFQFVVAIIIGLLSIQMCVVCFYTLTKLPNDTFYLQDTLGILQLEQVFMKYDEVIVLPNRITLKSKTHPMELSLLNRKLILQPGTQYYLIDIDEVYFKDEITFLKIIYKRQNKTYEMKVRYG